MTYENADKFYRHVEVHAECIPDGNSIPGGCTCVWEGKFMLSVYLMVTAGFPAFLVFPSFPTFS